MAGGARDARILAIAFDAGVDGWGAVVRSSPDELHESGTEIVGRVPRGSPAVQGPAGYRRGGASGPAAPRKTGLDFFAAAENALVTHFFGRLPAPLAEGWTRTPHWRSQTGDGRSVRAAGGGTGSACSRCRHRRCCRLSPPNLGPHPSRSVRAFRPRLARVRGRRRLAHARRGSRSPGRTAASGLLLGRSLLLSAKYVRDGDGVGGAQRLTVMAVDLS